jgi:hypothetical protein
MECTCKKIWEDSLQSISDVKENIDNFLNTFDSSLIEKYMGNGSTRYPDRTGACVATKP